MLAPVTATELLERAKGRDWYHSMEIAPGHEVRGVFDTRPYVERHGFPDRMDGLRVLDVGTWDGFWAFEFERRGAEVVALDLDDERDLDWPPRRRPTSWPQTARGEGFHLVRELRGSAVERVVCNVYEATPERLGTFDLVFCGNVLIHLRDQLLALERIAGLCDGLFVSVEEYSRAMDLLPFPASRYRADREAAVVFWQPSRKTWRAMMWTAGFDRVTEHARFTLPATEGGWGVRQVVHHCRRR